MLADIDLIYLGAMWLCVVGKSGSQYSIATDNSSGSEFLAEKGRVVIQTDIESEKIEFLLIGRLPNPSKPIKSQLIIIL